MRRFLDKIIKAALDFAEWLGKLKRGTPKGPSEEKGNGSTGLSFKWDIVAYGGGYVVRFKDSRGSWIDMYTTDTLCLAERLYERITGKKWSP